MNPIYSHGPLDRSHKSLLDLLVRTDTEGVCGGCRGTCGDPYFAVRCDACGLPLDKCHCIAGIDY